MKRAKPSKILLVLAVMVAGGICMLLPEKGTMPVASMTKVVQSNQTASDTLADLPSDTVVAE